MKRFAVVLLCAVMCLGLLASCKGTGTALTVNGRKVDQAEYAFYLNFNRLSIFSDKSDYTKSDLEQARKAAIQQITANEVVRGKCQEYRLKPSAQQKEQLKDEKKALISSLGGNKKYLDYLGDSRLTDRGYEKLIENEVYYELLRAYTAEESETVYTDEMLRKFFGENYICVKYIRLSLVDEDGSKKTDAETAQIFEKAEEIKALADKGEQSFDTLIGKYSDDKDVLGGSEGIIISVLDAEGQPYLEAAFELEDNEVSDIVQDSDGLYIVHRLPVSAEYYEENRSYIHQTAIDFRFNELISEWTADAEVETKKVVNKINFGNIGKYVK